MLVRVQTVRVGIMRRGHAQRRGIFIHQGDEAADAAGYVFRHNIARFIGRGDHHAVQQLAKRDLFANLEVGRAAADDKILL